MIKGLLLFRFKQFGRIIKEIGGGYLILLGIVALGFFTQVIDSLMRSESYWMGLIGALLIASIHFSRKDSGFLRKLEVNRSLLFSLEYLLLSIPLAIIFLFGGNIWAVLIQTIGVILVALLPNPEFEGKSLTSNLNFPFISKYTFEAVGYLRRYALLIGMIYIGCLAASKFIVFPMLMFILMGMFFIAFFEEVEGKELFEAIHFEGGILKKKSIQYIGLYLMLMTPFIISFLIFHIQYWYLLLIVIFGVSTLILFNIFYKYAHYTPYRKRVYNSTGNAMFILGILVPFFYPVTLLYLVHYWRKANKNIQHFYAAN